MNTVSLLTTEANSLMEEIHNSAKRMPLILHKEDYYKWLQQDLLEQEVKDLLRPMESEYMTAYPISKLLYSRTENANVPEVTSSYNYDIELPVFIKGIKQNNSIISKF